MLFNAWQNNQNALNEKSKTLVALKCAVPKNTLSILIKKKFLQW